MSGAYARPRAAYFVVTDGDASSAAAASRRSTTATPPLTPAAAPAPACSPAASTPRAASATPPATSRRWRAWTPRASSTAASASRSTADGQHRPLQLRQLLRARPAEAARYGSVKARVMVRGRCRPRSSTPARRRRRAARTRRRPVGHVAQLVRELPAEALVVAGAPTSSSHCRRRAAVLGPLDLRRRTRDAPSCRR